jgi:hypothetical protein
MVDVLNQPVSQFALLAPYDGSPHAFASGVGMDDASQSNGALGKGFPQYPLARHTEISTRVWSAVVESVAEPYAEAQEREALLACQLLNRMQAWGRPQS